MQPRYAVIKLLSIGLMASAIAFELWNLIVQPDWATFPSVLPKLIGVGRVALAIHCIEGVVAAIIVRSSANLDGTSRPGLNALGYGVYTFWVGTVGLQELRDGQRDG